MITELIVHPDELTEKQIDKLVKAGVKVLGIHPVGGKEATDALAELVEKLKTDEYRALIDYAVEKGLEIEYELHAASYLMPRSLFSARPEFFRANDEGVRDSDNNFCVSNGEALDLFAKNAATLARSLYKSKHVFNFWMDDKKNSHCKCEKCRNLSASDQQLVALNAMLREIKKDFPDAKMPYLAYMDSILPPSSIAPEDGIFLEYAPFEKYTAKSDDAPMLIAREQAMTKPLMNFFGGERKVLEYWYDNSLFSHWKKPPQKFILDKDGMAKDIAKYKELGFDYISSFACYLGPDYDELYDEVDFADFIEMIEN